MKKEKAVLNGELCDLRRAHDISLNELKTKNLVEKTLNDQITSQKTKVTKLEEEICYKVDKLINGKWIGVDLIVSEDREKVPPYVLEINSQPGHVGYDSVHGGSILKDVLVKFMNRDNWS